MRKTVLALLAACAAGAAGAARADLPSDLARCRAVADATARLACYDALAAMPPASPAPVSAGAPVAAAPAAPAASAFGFENRRPAELPETLESRLSGPFEGWGPTTRFKLDNGQVWQVIDGSRGVANLRDPKVRLSRASFGTFFLEIEGLKSAPRVKRVE